MNSCTQWRSSTSVWALPVTSRSQQAGSACPRAFFMIAVKGGMNAWFQRQIRCQPADRVHAGILVVTDDGFPLPWLGRLQDLYFFVNAQDLHHFSFELGVAALERALPPAHRGFCTRCLESAWQYRHVRPKVHAHTDGGPTDWSSTANGIAEVPGFWARQIDRAIPWLGCDRRLPTRPRTIVQRRHGAGMPRLRSTHRWTV